MRHFLLTAALLTCAGFLEAADFTPTPLATLAGENLAARWNAHWADRTRLLQRLYVDGYAKHGQHGTWDGEVAKMTKALCSGMPADKAIALAAQAAVQTGCNDPLVRYRLLVDHHSASMGMMAMRDGQSPEVASLKPFGSEAPRTVDFLDLGEAMTKAGYSPLLELSALWRGLSVMRETEAADAALCDRLVATTVRITPAVAAEVGDDRAMLDDVFIDRSLIITERIPDWLRRSPLATRLVEAMPKATLGLDAWWQDTLIGGYQAMHSYVSADASLRTSARARLERAVQTHPERGYPASVLLALAIHDRPTEARRWFEAAVRADPMQQNVQLNFIMFLANGPNPAEALLAFGMECADVRGQPFRGCLMNCINQIADHIATRARQPDQIWQDRRLWRMFDTAYPDNTQNQGDRMACAWRCAQKAEAVRLWRLNPKLRASPYIIMMCGAQQEQITTACASWAAENVSAETPLPAPKVSDF